MSGCTVARRVIPSMLSRQTARCVRESRRSIASPLSMSEPAGRQEQGSVLFSPHLCKRNHRTQPIQNSDGEQLTDCARRHFQSQLQQSQSRTHTIYTSALYVVQKKASMDSTTLKPRYTSRPLASFSLLPLPTGECDVMSSTKYYATVNVRDGVAVFRHHILAPDNGRVRRVAPGEYE